MLPWGSRLLLLCTILALGVVPAFPGLKIIFLDVGQGDCILVQCPGNGGYILIDCGTTKAHKNNDSVAIKAFLKKNKAKTKNVVVTHGDTDHYRIISYLLMTKALDPETIIVGGLASDYTTDHDGNETCGKDQDTPCDSLPTKGQKKPTQGETFFSRLEALNKEKNLNKGKLSILPADMTGPKGAWLLPPGFREPVWDSIVSCSSMDPSKGPSEGSMRFQVLSANYPPEKSSSAHNVNARSIVLRMEYTPQASTSTNAARPVHVYFMGDAEEDTEGHIMPPDRKRPRDAGNNEAADPSSDMDTSDDEDEAGSRLPEKPPGSDDRPLKKLKPAVSPKAMDEKTEACFEGKPDPPPLLQSPYVVLKVGHHGSEHGTGEKWLAFIGGARGKPDAAAISAGGSTPHGHPRRAVLGRLDPQGGRCKNSRAIACYDEKGAQDSRYRLSPTAVDVYSTHLGNGQGLHLIFDLDSREWMGCSTIKALGEYLSAGNRRVKDCKKP